MWARPPASELNSDDTSSAANSRIHKMSTSEYTPFEEIESVR
jgi:hypothetical protein